MTKKIVEHYFKGMEIKAIAEEVCDDYNFIILRERTIWERLRHKPWIKYAARAIHVGDAHKHI